MTKTFRIISRALSTLTVAAVVLLAVLLVGVRLVGLTPYTVLSGSMEPTYHVGSVIYVEKVSPEELKVGDPVTFRLSGGVVATHRIIELIDGGTANASFRTQGDANDTPDGISPPSSLIGRPVFSVPYMGYISAFLQTPRGMITVGGAAAALMLLSWALESVFAEPSSKEKADEASGENEDKKEEESNR